MPIWYLFLALLFIIVNGVFVAAEFAIIKVRPTQLAEMAAAGNRRARMSRRIVKRLDSYLSATQLGITLTSRAKGDDRIPMAGVPHHAARGYIAARARSRCAHAPGPLGSPK